jgi:hypothetical protein
VSAQPTGTNDKAVYAGCNAILYTRSQCDVFNLGLWRGDKHFSISFAFHSFIRISTNFTQTKIQTPMTEDYHQGFRVVSASSSTPTGYSTIFIPSKLDKKTGERIVLWGNIQREIKNANRVRNGNTSVVFMTDDDFEE